MPGVRAPRSQWLLGKKLRAPGLVEAERRKGCRPSGFRTTELAPRPPSQEWRADLGQGACGAVSTTRDEGLKHSAFCEGSPKCPGWREVSGGSMPTVASTAVDGGTRWVGGHCDHL